jgi:hypothetical protein
VVVWKSCKKGLREDGIIQTKPKYDSTVIKLAEITWTLGFILCFGYCHSQAANDYSISHTQKSLCQKTHLGRTKSDGRLFARNGKRAASHKLQESF